MGQYEVNYKERMMGIIKPQLAKDRHKFDEWITKTSSEWQREACVQLSRYLNSECDYGISMDTTDECWKNLKIRAFKNTYYDECDEAREGLIGVVCFQEDQEFSNLEGVHTVLAFCWVHPFYRNKGLLKREWKNFTAKFGDFLISNERSKAMKSFLDFVGYDDEAMLRKFSSS